MTKKETTENILKQLLQGLPPNLRVLRDDLEKHLRMGLQNVFTKLDLVTREEFDTQVAVLKRSREKLEALEALVATLEKKK